MKHQTGVTPSGAKLVMVDFDGTLAVWGPLEGPFTPSPGGIKAVQAIADAGYRIGIFTSRMSPTWWRDEGRDPWFEQTRLEETLQEWGIPFEFITSEKVPAHAYIDDRAIQFKGSWRSVLNQLGL